LTHSFVSIVCLKVNGARKKKSISRFLFSPNVADYPDLFSREGLPAGHKDRPMAPEEGWALAELPR
jgi:hypothetical protein